MRLKTAAVVLGLSLALFAGSPASAITIQPLNGSQLVVLTDSTGKTREEAIDAAKREAVLASAGRVLLDGKLIYADTLLEKYLSNYFANFVYAVEVLKDDYVAGANRMSFKIFVDYERLIADLEEKKFIYEPAYRPPVLSFISETLDGRSSDDGVARTALAEALRAGGLKPYEAQVLSPPLTVDVRTDDFLLQSALVTAQRNGAEVIVTGTARTTRREQRKLYYDTFEFYDCNLSVQFIRVDTGETILTASATGSASAIDRAEAIRQSIQRAAQSIAKETAPKFMEWWPLAVQGDGNYQILLTGTDDELLRTVRTYLEQLKGGASVYLLKKFDKSAVLVLKTDSSKDDILAALAACPYPTLTVVNPEAKNGRFEVQVGG